MDKIVKGKCHSCRFRHSMCQHCAPKGCKCRHWKLGKCYTCKWIDIENCNFLSSWCETWCFGGCKKYYKRDWKKTFKLLKLKLKNKL